MTDILVGYEIGTGAPVKIPLRNLAVTGQTQESGKTTTLEALVDRSGVNALTFITKRGEGSFGDGRRITPYFRDRADWQFVDALLEAALGEKNKFLRQFLIPICRNTKTLKQVQHAVRGGLKKAKGVKEGALVQLDAYLDLIVPEIERANLADRLDLQPRLNVMDVSDFTTPMQMLFVQSALDWINAKEKNTIVVIPEAWEFIPEGKGSPVKDSAITLVRKGSGIGNRIWVDSQDMAGVDKVILRGTPIWIIGVQREANEIKRNLANIPASVKKPKAADVAMLARGEFFVCWGAHCIKTYVQPKWLSIPLAIARAVEPDIHIEAPAKQERAVTEDEAKAMREENLELKTQNAGLKAQVASLTQQVQELGERTARFTAAAPAPIPQHKTTGLAVPVGPQASAPNQLPMDTTSILAELRRQIEADPVLMKLLMSRPEIEVTVKREIVKMDASTQPGMLAFFVSEGFFDEARSTSDAVAELKRRGQPVHPANVSRDLGNLAKKGFLFREEGNTFRAVPGMKINIVEA